MKGRQILLGGALGRGVCCHSRFTGMACLPHWIPAFAGMTKEAGCWLLLALMKAWSCHPRYAGMACVPHWIPAFARMTGWMDVGFFWHDGGGILVIACLRQAGWHDGKGG